MKILCQFEDLLVLSKSEIRTLFGGKLLGLYEAHLLGIKVPQTFMIHSQLCKEFLETHPSKNPREFKEEAARFIEKNLSFDELPEGLYAVRSSAQAEDGSSKSYAGIFDTELNVSKKSISKAIADVWSSLLETKAKAYEKSWIPFIENDLAGGAENLVLILHILFHLEITVHACGKQ